MLNMILGGLISWKTTVTAVITSIVMLLNTFGVVDIPPNVKDGLIVTALFFIGWFAKDANKTGKPEDQVK